MNNIPTDTPAGSPANNETNDPTLSERLAQRWTDFCSLQDQMSTAAYWSLHWNNARNVLEMGLHTQEEIFDLLLKWLVAAAPKAPTPVRDAAVSKPTVLHTADAVASRRAA